MTNTQTLGRVVEIVRYPIKSMAGIRAESAVLGWHGLQGDRRFAFRRLADNSGFPWLSASRLPQLLLYQPLGLHEQASEPTPTHVRTPEAIELPLDSTELRDNVAEKLGQPLELMKLRQGVFDEATVSVIALSTIAAIAREADMHLDTRRFRANIVVELDSPEPFVEDTWIGHRLSFGDNESAPIVSVTMRDERCVMINFDPDTAAADARVMKTVVRLNDNCAGVYATVLQPGEIRVGDTLSLVTDAQAN